MNLTRAQLTALMAASWALTDAGRAALGLPTQDAQDVRDRKCAAILNNLTVQAATAAEKRPNSYTAARLVGLRDYLAAQPSFVVAALYDAAQGVEG